MCSIMGASGNMYWESEKRRTLDHRIFHICENVNDTPSA